jgi:hypothetical protein
MSAARRRRVPARTAPEDVLPDVRDGLTRVERVVLETLRACQHELGDRSVPTALLYGRVVERVDLSTDELMRVLRRLAGR